MSSKKIQISPSRNEGKKKRAVINVEFYNSDSQFLKPAEENGQKFEFNFYASKVFHSGMTISGPGQFWGRKGIIDEKPTTKQLIVACLIVVWMFLVCISSCCLAAYILLTIIKDKDLNRPEYIIFILVEMIMISLSLWSGAVFMRRCHALASGVGTGNSPLPEQVDHAEEIS